MLGGSVLSVPVFKGAQEPVESGVLLPLSKGVHEIISDVGLFSVIRGTQLKYAKAYLAYHRSLEVDWDDEVGAGWFPYVSTSGDVLDVPAREITISKRSADDIQMKRSVGAVRVEYKDGPHTTLEDAQVAVRSVVGSSSGVHDHAKDVPINEEEDITEEDAPWDLRDLMSKDDRGPSPLQRVQHLCRKYGLSIPTDVQSIQHIFKDAMVALATTGTDEVSLSSLRETHAAKKAELEKSLAASEEKLADAERRFHEFKHTKDTVEELATKMDDSERLKAQYAVTEGLVEGARVALAPHKAASPQRIAAVSKDRDKLLAAKTAVEAEFCQLPTSMQARIDSVQASLDGEKERRSTLDSESVSRLISEKSFRSQLQLCSTDSQEVEDLKYRLDGAVAKERLSETIIKSLREQLVSVRSDVDKYREWLPLYTERFTADITDAFSGFLFSIVSEVKKLVEKQRKDIKSTVKADLEAIDAFLRSLDSKLNRPGPSS